MTLSLSSPGLDLLQHEVDLKHEAVLLVELEQRLVMRDPDIVWRILDRDAIAPSHRRWSHSDAT